ncbi:DUF6503 family protein [Aurantibacter sp.]|uniref:DUF6503 family protein n=1 Tax=Aurantibacter sp. TaxID=2807103 RepID=UPI00326665C7
MKKILSIIVVFMLFACKENDKKEAIEGVKQNTKIEEVSVSRSNMDKVFEAHGGMDLWKSQRTLAFMLPNPDDAEIHTIDLRTRKEKIKTNNWITGSNGKDIWLLDERNSYKGDPIFYHNLMFYFYSMPFVLGDKGINYSEVENLEFEGESFPGVKVSFDDGIGVSSKDDYRLFYDPETYQMKWLGYTVSYRTGEKSDKVSWIRYDDWNTTGGLVLPNSITWYANENGLITEPRKTVNFENVEISKDAKPSEFYDLPENAKVVTKTK